MRQISFGGLIIIIYTLSNRYVAAHMPKLQFFHRIFRGGSADNENAVIDEKADFLRKYYVSEEEIKAIETANETEERRNALRKKMMTRQRMNGYGYNRRSSFEDGDDNYFEEKRDGKEEKQWFKNLPKINLHCDPLINFKLKQRFVMLGACITLGMDYLSDIAQWRSYCAIEDTFVKGRFSLRGSELGWAKSWLLNLGLGEENTAKFKLRLGLNLKSYKAYAKLRFRTEPISPFDIGDGISCAGKLPMPLFLLPVLRSIPLRVEYKMRINSSKLTPTDLIHSSRNRRKNKDKVVFVTTGIGTVDLSLDELNFCLEWDEKSPLWGIDIVRSDPVRKIYSGISKVESPFNGFKSPMTTKGSKSTPSLPSIQSKLK
mmetsp:Transcript_29015/g.39863  ORF Transcript_29015/g.39863 Transcript_29015/m.39863 type:complete len:373 (+) Transcript_29015:2-1120(+)